MTPPGVGDRLQGTKGLGAYVEEADLPYVRGKEVLVVSLKGNLLTGRVWWFKPGPDYYSESPG